MPRVPFTFRAAIGIVLASAAASWGAFEDLPGEAAAQEPVVISKSTVPSVPVAVTVGHSSVLQFQDPIERASVNDATIADVVVVSPTELLMHGRGLGSTSLIVWRNGSTQLFTVTVEPDLDVLQTTLQQLLPDETIELYSASGFIVLTGEVSSEDAMDQAGAIAESYSPNVKNFLTVRVRQVLIEVRFAEVDRTLTKNFGVDYIIQDKDITHSGFIAGALSPQVITTPQFTRLEDSDDIALSSVITQLLELRTGPDLAIALKALEEKGLLRILAEPNLLAMSGEEASFLAGGEFPIPVVQSAGATGVAGSAVTIEFKEFGIRLNFKPTVMSNEEIRIFVEPEVSVLDFGPAAVKIGGFEVPGLVTRRASTTVQMRSGESLVISGLLSQIDTRTEGKVPWLGNVPILGKLFRSEKFKREETELLVLVTPRLVTPSIVDVSEPFGDPAAIDQALKKQLGPPPYPDPRGEVLRDALGVPVPVSEGKPTAPGGGAALPVDVVERRATLALAVQPKERTPEPSTRAPEPHVAATGGSTDDEFMERAQAISESIDSMSSALEQEAQAPAQSGASTSGNAPAEG